MYSKIIAVDFDGTLCEGKWPEIGEPNEEIILYLKRQRIDGAKIILWTCRVGERLSEAVRWCHVQGLTFDAVNENIPEIIAAFGTDTRKIFANEYIDDRNRTISEFTSKITPLYICDRRACEKCSYPYCKHTEDISHAMNFAKSMGSQYFNEYVEKTEWER